MQCDMLQIKIDPDVSISWIHLVHVLAALPAVLLVSIAFLKASPAAGKQGS